MKRRQTYKSNRVVKTIHHLGEPNLPETLNVVGKKQVDLK